MISQASKTTALRTSVAICTFNGARYLPAQLQSIASQTRCPDEMVVCDDRSDDGTSDILERFQADARFPVRIFRNAERLGPAKNFEKAIGLCEADIIVLCDQDDVWRKHKLDSLTKVFDERPDAVYAFSDAEMIDDNGRLLGQTLWEAMGLKSKIERFSGQAQLELLLRHNLIPGAAMAFRARFREVLSPVPAGWMHDYWIVLLGSVFSCGVPVPEPLFEYRRHSNQVCGWKKKSFFQVWMDSLASQAQERWGKLDSFRELVSRVNSIQTSDRAASERIQLLKEKESHLFNRARARSAHGFSRIVDVLGEVGTGRYHRFSDSWYSILRDL